MIAALPKGGDQNPAYSAPPFIARHISASQMCCFFGRLQRFSWGRNDMKSALAAVFAVLLSSSAFAQEDERVKRIVERIEKEIRESHDRTREEIRAILRAEIQKGAGAVPAPRPPEPPKPPPPPKPEPAPTVRRVYLGITAGDLTDAERKALGVGGGIKIADVRGPAKQADLRAGDILVELDGEPVTEEKIGGILGRRKPGDTVDAVVLRANKRVTAKVTLAERKD